MMSRLQNVSSLSCPQVDQEYDMALLDARRRPGRGRLPFSRRPATGRHRLRRSATVPEPPDVERKAWDEKQQARAEQLGLLEPGWLVIYGVYSRRFYAIARTAEV